MSERLFIAIPVKNRRPIVERCVPTVIFRTGDKVVSYDDAEMGIGIEAQRRLHFRDFWNERDSFTHLYLTDSDAIHDPNWRSHALYLQSLTGLPVCLYDTEAHVRLNCVVEDDPSKPYLIRRVAPGISYLLTVEHVARVMKFIDVLEHWDWMVPQILGHRMCIARQSHVDHLGVGGLHHPASEGYDGGDRARNPTPWLVKKRAEIVAELCSPSPPTSTA